MPHVMRCGNGRVMDTDAKVQGIMQIAKKHYEGLQRDLETIEVEGRASKGRVIVKMDGRKRLLSVEINCKNQVGAQALAEMVMTAVNNAGREVDDAMQFAVGEVLGEIGVK